MPDDELMIQTAAYSIQPTPVFSFLFLFLSFPWWNATYRFSCVWACDSVVTRVLKRAFKKYFLTRFFYFVVAKRQQEQVVRNWRDPRIFLEGCLSPYATGCQKRKGEGGDNLHFYPTVLSRTPFEAKQMFMVIYHLEFSSLHCLFHIREGFRHCLSQTKAKSMTLKWISCP